MRRSFLVIQTHQASYAEPVSLRQGDPLHLTGREDSWDGHRWLWAIAADGRQGWVPDDLVDPTTASPVALKDYTAVELGCQRGEVLSGTSETHGWIWCQNTAGKTGWVPARNLTDAHNDAASLLL